MSEQAEQVLHRYRHDKRKIPHLDPIVFIAREIASNALWVWRQSDTGREAYVDDVVRTVMKEEYPSLSL